MKGGMTGPSGPPPPPRPPELQSVTVRLPEDLVKAVDAYAQKFGVTRTMAIGHLLAFALGRPITIPVRLGK
jgi:hypothetical protein